MIVDAHVRVGCGREVDLPIDGLLRQMDDLGIDHCVIAPDERSTAVANADGNTLTTSATHQHPDRLSAYAVANPWYGAAALEHLRRAHELGSDALAIDATIQGFDLLDGLVDPLLELAADWDWPVYVRTGTPPTALPLPLAELARRFPTVSFLMGRSGATDFWIDAAPALLRAGNLFADTSYAPWDTVLDALAGEPAIGTDRIIFCSDAPYALARGELRRMMEWPLTDTARAQVLGGNASRLFTLPGTHDRP